MGKREIYFSNNTDKDLQERVKKQKRAGPDKGGMPEVQIRRFKEM